MRPTAAGAIALLVFVLTGCASTNSCNDEKCGGPTPDIRSTFVLTVDGKTFTGQPGTSPAVNVRAGAEVPITLTISSLSGLTVHNVYLYMSGYPSGGGYSAGPTGKVKILSHLAGSLAPSHQIRVRWPAQALFGSRQIDLSVMYLNGTWQTAWPLARMTLTP